MNTSYQPPFVLTLHYEPRGSKNGFQMHSTSDAGSYDKEFMFDMKVLCGIYFRDFELRNVSLDSDLGRSVARLAKFGFLKDEKTLEAAFETFIKMTERNNSKFYQGVKDPLNDFNLRKQTLYLKGP